MKRKLAALLALLLLSGCAQAEIVGYSGADYIHRWLTPGGESLFFVSSEREVRVTPADLNGDGREDIAVLTAAGTSNAMYEFFLNTQDGYRPVRHPAQSYGLCNYTVYADSGLVLSVMHDGAAAWEKNLFRWSGTELVRIRSSVCAPFTETTWEEDGWRMTHETGSLHITVTDHTGGEPAVIWETVCTAAEYGVDAGNGSPAALEEQYLLQTAPARTWYVNGKDADRVNLREGPSRSTAALGQYYTGTQVSCGASSGGWTQVTVGAQTGWMMSEYLLAGADAEGLRSTARTAAAANTDWLPIRSAPAAEAGALMTIRGGTAVRVLGELNGGWCYVDTGTVQGYVPAEYLAK